MRKFLPVIALVLAACTSTRATAPVTPPEIRVTQTSGIPAAARYVSGSIPVRYTVRVANRAAEPITLKRITAQSIGSGAYELRSQSKPFNEQIAPGAQHDVELWASGYIADPSILGANGPVTVRLLLHFDSPKGEFDEMVVQQVNAIGSGQEP
jgi:hypothetical protein